MGTMTARTRGTLIPLRSHEDHEGPIFDIEPEEKAEYDARPFVRLSTTAGQTVATAHDLFEFKLGDAERLCLCWNTLEHLDDATVERLAAWLERYNGDELNQMMDEEDTARPYLDAGCDECGVNDRVAGSKYCAACRGRDVENG